jgi:flagellar biosynthesis protein FlhB
VAENDDGQKTEDPSSRRLQNARDEGRVAQSREINTWFILASGTLLLIFVVPDLCHSLVRSLAVFVEPQRLLAPDGIAWGPVYGLLRQIAVSLALPFGMFVIAAATGSVAQTGFVFATERLRFDISHISPGSGLKRLVSLRSLVELGKSVVKVAVVSITVAVTLRGEIVRLANLGTLSAAMTGDMIGHLVLRLLLGVLAILTLLAGADYVYQRFQHLHSLRMTKREVKEESKQSEGDPMVKARLRQIRMDRARRRMMAAVPTASVVITNPTHYAVALRYEMGASGAPRVVAKGADLIALRIRELAEENAIPIVENPPLARALHAGVEIDSEVPPEHYKAVAEIISYVFRLKGKIRAPAAAV